MINKQVSKTQKWMWIAHGKFFMGIAAESGKFDHNILILLLYQFIIVLVKKKPFYT